jgi:hypothetical protein
MVEGNRRLRELFSGCGADRLVGGAMRAILLATAFLAAGLGAAGAKSVTLKDRTILHYEPQHGTQIEYLSANGMSYLWYPGNNVIVPAPWKLKGGSICFLYPARSYNPVTKTQGGNWECEPTSAYYRTIKQTMPGDMFGLSARKLVPFVIQRGQDLHIQHIPPVR